MTTSNTTIQLKKSLTSGNTPSSLANGEIALNAADAKLFYAQPDGTVSYITNQKSFDAICVDTTLILASSGSDTLNFAAGANISLSACTTSKTITISAFGDGGGGGGGSGGANGNTGAIQFAGIHGAFSSNPSFHYDVANNWVVADIISANIYGGINQTSLEVYGAASNINVYGPDTGSDHVTIYSANTGNIDNLNIGQTFAANAKFIEANTRVLKFDDGTSMTTAAASDSQFVRDTANTANLASSNTIYTQGVDATQNTRITTVEANTVYLFGALNQTNTNIGLANTQLKAYTDGAISSAVSSANTQLKSYTDGLVSSANTQLKSYTDGLVSSSVSSANTQLKSYTDGAIDSANTQMHSYVDGQISTTLSYVSGVDDAQNNRISTVEANTVYLFGALNATNTSITNANTQLKEYTDGAIGSANTQLKSHVDGQISYVSGVNTEQNTRITTVEANTVYLFGALDATNNSITNANTQLKSYTDGAISSSVSSANNQLKSYTDGAISSSVSSANTQLKSYVDGQINYTQGTNDTQNTRLTTVEANTVYLFGALDATNNSITNANTQLKSYTDGLVSTSVSTANTQLKAYTDGAISSANTQLKAYTDGQISYNQSINDTQNTRITTVEANTVYLFGALDATNNSITNANTQLKSYTDGLVSSSVSSANTQLKSYTDGAISSAVSSANNQLKSYTDGVIASSNTQVVSYIDGQISSVNDINNTQNTNITTATNLAQGAYDTANLKFNTSGGNITGDVIVSANLTITGNLTVSGNVTTISANNLIITDNMIYLNDGNQVTNPDLGFAGNYNDGTYHHAGFFRDHSDGFWKVFDNYKPEPDASPYIDTSNATFRIADFQANNVTFGKITTSSSQLVTNLNADYLNGQHGSYYAVASEQNGINATQNTNITNTQTWLDANIAYISGVNIAQNSSIVNANTQLKAYTDGLVSSSVSSANTQLKSYTDGAIISAVSSANNQLKSYTDGAISSSVSSANTQIKSYVDGFISYGSGVDTTQNTRISTVEANTVYLFGALNQTNANIGLANTQLRAYTDGAIASANTQLKSYTDGAISSSVSSANTQLKSYVDGFISYGSGVDVAQNSRISTVESNTVYLFGALNQTNTNIVSANTQLKAYTDGLVSSANTQLKAYADGIVSSANTQLKAYTDGAIASSNTQLKTYVDGQVSTTLSYVSGVDTVQNTRITTVEANTIYLFGALNQTNTNIGLANTQLRSYTDGAIASANTQLKSYTDGAIASANTQLKAYTDGQISYGSGVNTSQNTSISALQTLANTDYTTVVATAGSYGSSTTTPTVTLAANGRITSATSTSIAFPVTSVGGLGVTGAVSNNQILASILAVDGAGSGLDADLLDGQSASYYAVATVENGINATQNTRITTVEANTVYLFGALNQTNTNIVSANTQLKAYTDGQISYGSGVNTSQNTSISALQTLANTDYTTISVTAGDYGSATIVPVIKLAANGRISAISNTNIVAGATITDDTTTNASRYVMLGQSTSGSYTVANTSSTKLTYNPSTGTLSSTKLTLTPGTSGVTTGLYINGGDITAARSDTTGVIYLGTNASTYLYFDGTNYIFGGSNTVVATAFSGSGASLTSLTAGNLSGTIPSAVLGNSTHYVGTTAIALNRASGSQALTGISSIDGAAAAVNTTGGAVLAYTPASTGVGVASGLGPYVGYGRSAAYAAGFSLHRAGAYAINVGLDTDNYFRIGGWSDGLNTYRMTLDTAGAAVFRGNVTAYSDIRLKENIKVIPNALDKVKGIRGVTFTRNDIEDKEKVHTGVIAQEVLEVFPEAVTSNNDGPYYSIAYGNMVGLLIEAIKEQQKTIESQNERLSNLEKLLKV